MKVIQNYHWTHCDTTYFIKTLPLLWLLLHLKCCHLHQMLPCFSHIEPTIKHRYTLEGWKINPLGWGFSIQKGRMMGVTMTEPPPPSNVFKIVHYSCKTGCKTMTCSCCKHGLTCTDFCKKCQEVSCINCQEVDLDVFDEHD